LKSTFQFEYSDTCTKEMRVSQGQSLFAFYLQHWQRIAA